MDRSWRPLKDEALDREIEQARERSATAAADEPRAQSARYDPRTRRIEIELTNGCMFAFPVASAQGLRDAPDSLLERVEIVGEGTALHWEELDTDYTVAGLLAGRLGTRVWMRELARRAGSASSSAKARAARENGRKGGRPRKQSKG